MEKLRFTWDQKGRLTAVGEPPRDVLADYLANELQADPVACRGLLDTVRLIRAGACEQWEGEGCTWSLLLTRARAQIVSEHAIPGRRVTLSLEELEEAVASWLHFVELARS